MPNVEGPAIRAARLFIVFRATKINDLWRILVGFEKFIRRREIGIADSNLNFANRIGPEPIHSDDDIVRQKRFDFGGFENALREQSVWKIPEAAYW
jgi:hypothetical protein